MDSLNLYPDYQSTISLLKETGINDDFISSGNIRYTHRTLSDRDIYFISNRNENYVTDTCVFRNGATDAELWDPVTGEIKRIETNSLNGGASAVFLKLEAFQSFFYRLLSSAKVR